MKKDAAAGSGILYSEGSLRMEKISPMKRCIAKWTKKDRVGYLFIFPAVLVL